jgi:hypothetical protein
MGVVSGGEGKGFFGVWIALDRGTGIGGRVCRWFWVTGADDVGNWLRGSLGGRLSGGSCRVGL